MPSKGKRTASGAEDGFLFVNEDFNTLFRGAKNADLDRSKQSHVQRRSFAKRRKDQRASGLVSSPTSPTLSEDAQSPVPGSSLAPLRSQSDTRVSILPFPASDSLWLPLVTDEDPNTTTAEPQLLTSFDSSQPPYWRPTDPPFPQQSPYALPQVEKPLSSRSPLDEELTSPPPSALRTSIETITEPEDAFPFGSMTTQNDPFSNVQVALEKWAPPLMRQYTMKMMHELFYTDLRATSLHNMRHVEYLHEDMRSCMANPSEMYALLAASSCHALIREGKLDLPDLDPEHSNRVILLFKSKALEALRLRLSRGELNQGIVIAIQRLICAAQWTNNLSAVEAHYGAAISMIKTIGGLETFNDFHKERLIIHDFLHALNTRSQPRMELTCDPGELVADVNLELVIYMQRQRFNPGQRIRSIAEDSELVLYPAVARCIPELVETQNVLEWLRENSYRPAEYRWLAHRRLANVHRLLNVDRESLVGSLDVVRLALLYYCILVRAIPYSYHDLMDQYVVSELKQWEADAMEVTFGSCVDLLLWIMVMFGIGMAKLAPGAISPSEATAQQSSPRKTISQSDKTRAFDVSALITEIGRRACNTLEIRSETQLRDLMRTFLFDEDFVDDRYLTLATDELCLDK